MELKLLYMKQRKIGAELAIIYGFRPIIWWKKILLSIKVQLDSIED